MKTVTVTAPLCAPSRQAITGQVRKQLAPYHFRDPKIDATLVKDSGVPQWWIIRVKFSDDAAAWGEYVLMRFGYHPEGALINPKNEKWVNNRLGKPATGSWYESDCKNKPKNTQFSQPGMISEANPPTPWEVRRAQERQPRGWLSRILEAIT